MKSHKVRYGSEVISFDLVFKKRKTLGIKVFPDCSVRIEAPYLTSLGNIEAKVKEKAAWIIKQQREFLSYHPLAPKRLFVNGETHLYLGRQYKLRIEQSNVNNVKIYRGRLVLSCEVGTRPKDLLKEWYRKRAQEQFYDIMATVLPLFDKYKITKPQLYIKTMPKRWGSCTPAGKVLLNPMLIKAPKGSIEYVVIHELCHLVYPNHTKAFYRLQEKVMPDWKKWKERLEYSLTEVE